MRNERKKSLLVIRFLIEVGVILSLFVGGILIVILVIILGLDPLAQVVEDLRSVSETAPLRALVRCSSDTVSFPGGSLILRASSAESIRKRSVSTKIPIRR